MPPRVFFLRTRLRGATERRPTLIALALSRSCEEGYLRFLASSPVFYPDLCLPCLDRNMNVFRLCLKDWENCRLLRPRPARKDLFASSRFFYGFLLWSASTCLNHNAQTYCVFGRLGKSFTLVAISSCAEGLFRLLAFFLQFSAPLCVHCAFVMMRTVLCFAHTWKIRRLGKS